MRVLALAALVGSTIGFISGDSDAQAVTGEQLLELCSPQAPDASHEICLGYIIGSFEASVVNGGVCTPPTVTHRQVRDTVLKFILNHPERLQEPAPHLVYAGMAEAFPCR